MADLINTGVGTLTPAKRGSIVPLQIFNSLGANGANVFKEDLQVVLAVYDLDLYLEHQRSFDDAGFRETDESFFNGAKTKFDDLMPDHRVKAGSGVLFRATLKLGKKAVKFKNADGTTGTNTVWFVKERIKIDKVEDPAYTLQIQHPSAIDEDGKALDSGVVDMREIGLGGAPAADFARLTKGGHVKRRITFRYLSEDESTVLLSQMNPKHNPMTRNATTNKTLDITYDPQGKTPEVGQPAAPLAEPPAPAPTVPKLDLTGFYVLERPGGDPRTKAQDLISPAAIFIHHVGRAACGWYYPVPDEILDANQPLVSGAARKLFQGTVRNDMPGTTRMVFALGGKVEGDGPVFPVDFFVSTDKVNPEDPEVLRAVKDKSGSQAGQTSGGTNDDRLISASQRRPGKMGFTFKDVTLRGGAPGEIATSFSLSFNDDTNSLFVFRRVHGQSRLPWSVLDQMMSENAVKDEVRAAARQALISEHMEPVPPGTLGAMVGWISSQPMLDLLARVATELSNGQGFSRRPNQIALNQALQAQADLLKSMYKTSRVPDVVIAQVRSIAAHTIIKSDTTISTVLSQLQDIAMSILESQVLKDTGLGTIPQGRPDSSDYDKHANDDDFSGYTEFNIAPLRIKDKDGKTRFKQFLYRLKFTSKSLDGSFGLVLSGSIGAFNVNVRKLDPDTLQDADPFNFPPTDFIGVLTSGGIGSGIKWGFSYTPSKIEILDKGKEKFVDGKFGKTAERKGGSSGGTEDCDIFSMMDIKFPTDFIHARFVIFAQQFPSGKIGLGPFGATTGQKSDTVFSITLPRHSPEVTLETEIKKGYDFDTTTPDGKDMIEYAKDIVEKKKNGEPLPIGEGNPTFYNLSATLGFFIDSRELSFVPRDIQIKDDMADLRRTPLNLNIKVVGAHFEKNSAFVSDDAREILELKLAVMRKVLEFPGWLDVQGTSSPEWTTAKRADALDLNSRLSNRRANSIMRAIFAAAGQPGKGVIPEEKEFIAMGKGADPFLSEFVQTIEEMGGDFHLDPFSPDASTEDGKFFIALDKLTFYPDLRRVDIFMNGVYALRILGD